MSFNLKQLQAFVWVADLKSFRAAADRLNTTQPNISARIASLETAFKTTLMERDAGSVQLTEKGKTLLTHARQVLDAVDCMIVASEESSLYKGVLRLGVTEMIAHTWLRDLLKNLKQQLPGILVELTIDMSDTLSQLLIDRTLDLALQNGPFNQKTSGVEDLGTYPLVWLAAPEIGKAQDPFAEFPVLTHARHTRLFKQISEYFANTNTRIIPSSNLAACLHMSVEGMGIASVPRVMADREIEAGKLIELNYPWHPENLAFCARYIKEKAPGYVHSAAQISTIVAKAFDNKR